MNDDSIMDHNVNHQTYADKLSDSYRQTLQRVADVTDECMQTYKIPKIVLNRRKKEWDCIFLKYSKESTDELDVDLYCLEPTELDIGGLSLTDNGLPAHKKKEIQSWLCTGSLPYDYFWNDSCDTSLSLDTSDKVTDSTCSLLACTGSNQLDVLDYLDNDKDLRRSDDIRDNDFSYASVLPSTIMANKTTKADNDACSKVDNVEVVKMELAKRLDDVNFHSHLDAHAINRQRELPDANCTPILKSQSLDNAKVDFDKQLGGISFSSHPDAHNIKQHSTLQDVKSTPRSVSQSLDNVKVELRKRLSIGSLSSVTDEHNIEGQPNILDIHSVPTSTSQSHVNVNMEVERRLDNISFSSLTDEHNVKAAFKQFANITSVCTPQSAHNAKMEFNKQSNSICPPSRTNEGNAKAHSDHLNNNFSASTSKSLHSTMEHSNSNNTTQYDTDFDDYLLSDDNIFDSPQRYALSSSSKVKLFTDRESPVDLTPPKRFSLNRKHQGDYNHPALDPMPENLFCHNRSKRKRKNGSLNTSKCRLSDFLTNSSRSYSRTQSFTNDTPDSTSSQRTPIMSPPPLKSDTSVLNPRGSLGEQLKHISIRENTTLNSCSFTTNEEDKILVINEDTTNTSTADDAPSSGLQSEQAQENVVESHTLNIVKTAEKIAETEGESTISVHPPTPLCRRNSDLTDSLITSKNSAFRVLNIDTDTFESDQSTTLLHERKTDTSQVCGGTVADSNTRDDLLLSNDNTANKCNTSDLAQYSPIVLLKRLDNNCLQKLRVDIKNLNDNLDQPSLTIESTPQVNTPSEGSKRKRRKIEPVVLLEKLDLSYGSPVKTNLLTNKTSNKKRTGDSIGNCDKLFVDVNSTFGDKKQDKSDVDSQKNVDPVVLLEKLRIKDNESITDDKLSDRRLENKESVDTPINQLATVSAANKKSAGRRRISARLTVQNANTVESCISDNTASSQSSTKTRHNPLDIYEVLSSSEEKEKTVTFPVPGGVTSTVFRTPTRHILQKVPNTPTENSSQRKNRSNRTNKKKIVTPSSTSSSANSKSRRQTKSPLILRSTSKGKKLVSLKNNSPAILQLDTSTAEESTPSSSVQSSIRHSGRNLRAFGSNKKLSSPSQANSIQSDNVSSNTRRSKSSPKEVVYFETILNSDSESGLPTPRSVASRIKNTEKLDRMKLRNSVKNDNAIQSNNSGADLDRSRKPKVPKKKENLVDCVISLIDTSDEEDASLELSGTNRGKKNRVSSLTERSFSLRTPAERMGLQHRQSTSTYNKRRSFFNKASNTESNDSAECPVNVRRNLRSALKGSPVKDNTEVSSRNRRTALKGVLFQTRRHYDADSSDVSS